MRGYRKWMSTNMAEVKRRFQHFSREEIKNKRVKATPPPQNKNVKANQKAAWALREFLKESEENEDAKVETFFAG